MAYVAVDNNGQEVLFLGIPERGDSQWVYESSFIEILKGSIKKLIGRELTWEDEPVELKEEK